MNTRRLLLALMLGAAVLLSGCNNPATEPEGPMAVTPLPANPPNPTSTAPSPGVPTDPAPLAPVPGDPDPAVSSPPDPAPLPVSAIPEIQGLVDITLLDDTFVIDLRYATENNFTGKKIYTQAKCLLIKETAEKLIAANREFAEMGYRLKIWDAYRPLSAQQTLWDVVSDRTFVADPKKGSVHNRGAAVDVTLVDEDGIELPMPTEFDDFSEKASITYRGCTEEEARNRELLAEVMVRNGFSRYSAEWWHFSDTKASEYPMLDVEFEEYDEIEETK